MLPVVLAGKNQGSLRNPRRKRKRERGGERKVKRKRGRRKRRKEREREVEKALGIKIFSSLLLFTHVTNLYLRGLFREHVFNR